MFVLQNTPIDYLKIKNSYSDSKNGALVSFEGLVRNDNVHDKKIASLLYIADEALCMKEGQLIVDQAIQNFNLNHAICVQRIGQVETLQTAIWIGTWATHRDEAFQGCRYIIEETKKRLLIWKKEFYNNGTSSWIHGAQTPVII